MEPDYLDKKKILIVDDEPDILEVLEELLPMCKVSKASNYEDARRLLESEPFDMAILDIMGVNGYGLLEIAKGKKIPAIMLTAHAFTPENLVRSIREGAASYIPKDEITRIADFMTDVFKAREKGIMGISMPSGKLPRDVSVFWSERDFRPSALYMEAIILMLK